MLDANAAGKFRFAMAWGNHLVRIAGPYSFGMQELAVAQSIVAYMRSVGLVGCPGACELVGGVEGQVLQGSRLGRSRRRHSRQRRQVREHSDRPAVC